MGSTRYTVIRMRRPDTSPAHHEHIIPQPYFGASRQATGAIGQGEGSETAEGRYMYGLATVGCSNQTSHGLMAHGPWRMEAHRASLAGLYTESTVSVSH